MSQGGITAAVVSVLVLVAFIGFLDEAAPSATKGASGTSGLAPGSGGMPSARDTHEMAYDAQSNRIVLFGGSSSSLYLCSLGDTWAYDVASNSWRDRHPALAPPARCCPGMAYDSKADRIIMFGGAAGGARSYLNDTWSYDLNTNTWTNMRPAVSPPARHGGPLVYDIRLDRIILFGGATRLALNDTWTYDFDSNTWTQVVTAISPSLRAFHAMAYDIESDRVVLFGGQTEPYSYASDETWVYDAVNETWMEMAPTPSPAPRFAAPAAYDAKADRFLVFGGTGYPDDSERNNTWAYDLNADTWSRIDTPSRPSNRLTAMAYDVRSDRTVLFGGTWPWIIFGTPAYNNETWVFDYENSTWAVAGETTPVPPPGEQGVPIWVWQLGAVGATGVAVAAYVIVRRRRKPVASRRGRSNEEAGRRPNCSAGLCRSRPSSMTKSGWLHRFVQPAELRIPIETSTQLSGAGSHRARSSRANPPPNSGTGSGCRLTPRSCA